MAGASAVGAPNDNASTVYWIVFIVGRSSEQRCIYSEKGKRYVIKGLGFLVDEQVNGGGFSRWIVVESGGGMEVKNTTAVMEVNRIVVVETKVNDRVVAVMKVNGRVGWSSMVMERWWFPGRFLSKIWSLILMKMMLLDEDGDE
ncbi:hypothetical protein QVD17_07699 [Tagetes erecta]|uniref:Uncharacterized protein n=1 Tax=Tagetes erecta TaxID=13708 RepID=A0AAD8LG89_TARER|nr:hypothetical protein QVD17_07699 [Tagetes erecta]